jgi:RNA polymerase sigma-70 factor (ECF subfamily)
VAGYVAVLDDLLLIDRCLEGEAAATGELFRRHRGRVHAALFRILGSNRDMDDLLQETFIQVFASLASFRGEARLSTWIDRIAVRVAYRHLRRKGPPMQPLDSLDDDLMPVSADGEHRCLAREGVRRLYAALAALPPASRIAFALHEIDGRPLAEVAACTGTSLTATKLRVWRARRSLERQAAADPILREFLADGEEVTP